MFQGNKYEAFRRHAALGVIAAGLATASPAFAEGQPAGATGPVPAITAAPVAVSDSQPVPAPMGPLLPIGIDGAHELNHHILDLVDALMGKPGFAKRVAFKDGKEPLTVAVGDHYETTLPPLVVTIPDGQKTVELGGGVVSVTPKPDDSLDLSSDGLGAITVTEGGKPVATAAFGHQSFVVTVLPQLPLVPQMSYKASGLRILGAESGADIQVGDINYSTRCALNDQRTSCDGAGNLILSNITVLNAKDPQKLSISKASVSAKVANVDINKLRRIQNFANGINVSKDHQFDPDKLLSLFSGVLSAYDANLTVEGLTVDNVAPGQSVAIGAIGFSVGVSDLDKDNVRAKFGISAGKLALPQMPEVQAHAKVIPTDAEITVSAARIPAGLPRALVEAGKKGDDKDDTQALLLSSLQTAATEIRIDTLKIDAPAVNAAATGSVQFAPAAVFGVVGGATVTLHGLDVAVAELKPAPGKPVDPETQKTLGMVTMLQAMGQLGKDEQGRETRTFKFDVTPTGQFLMNGADLSALMGAMGGGAPGGAPGGKAPAGRPAKPAN